MVVNAKAKRILILTDWYEPGYRAGGPIQSVKNFVAAMHESYDISIITGDRDLGSRDSYPGIQSNQWISREPGIQVYYAKRSTLKGRLMRKLIESQNPDFIYLNSMYSIPFTIIPLSLLWRKKIHAITIISPRGMLRESAIKFKSGRKKMFIGLLNFVHIPEKIRFHATDEQEKKDVARYFPRFNRVELIPNFSAAIPGELTFIKKIPGVLRCLYISRIMAIKNIQFFLQVLNLVPVSIRIELAIYGDIEDLPYWQESQKYIQSLPGHVQVSYNGSLPNSEVIKIMGDHHLFVLPTQGENFGHAIFESLSAGRPVMISDRTPWLGLKEKKAGWDLSLNDPDSWLKALQEAAAMDQTTYNDWSKNSRLFALEQQGTRDLKSEYKVLFS